jgi:anti-anti-sigma factor
MVGGSVILAAILSIISIGTLTRGRNQALSIASASLEAQGRTDLELIINRDAVLSAERIATIRNIGYLDTQAIIAALDANLVDITYVRNYAFSPAPSGDLTATQQGTSIVFPASADRNAVLADLQASAVLESILPTQHRTERDIVSVAYVGPSGAIRMYPAVDGTANLDRERSFLELYRGNERKPIWLSSYKSPRRSGLIWTLVTPIFYQQTFRGVIAIDSVLAQVTFDIAENLPTPGSSIFLLDNQQNLITAPPAGLALLTGHAQDQAPISLADAIYPLKQTGNQALDAVLARMANGENRVERLTIADRPYFLAYAPIEDTDWRVGLITPIEELTAEAARSSQVIVSTSQQALLIGLAITLGFVLLLALVSHRISRRIAQPLVDLAQAAQAIGQGTYNQQVAVTSSDEVGKVAAAFNTMSQSLLQAQAELAAHTQSLEATVQSRTTELQTVVAKLEPTFQQQAALNEVVRGLSTPVIPVLQGVLLMPLIGALDESRAHQTLETLLQRVESESARMVIIDVTGLPVMDTAVAHTLLQAAQATRLLGAKTILVGLRPEVAQTIVTLGMQLEDLHPVADLQTALMLAINSAQGRSAGLRR